MKFIKVFALFFLIHAAAWAGAHVYQNQHRELVLIVADTSYAMKPKFPAMQDWIENYETKARYKDIQIGTDKALLGNLADLKSKTVIFRTSFGSMTAESLARYQTIPASQKILLSDGKVQAQGWEVVKF
ncbi:hypothetical protein [Thiothrix eikelboomii]|uniref:hypothetical protein n=1 Tax=Thiothrix eikelboomii TaxID=92487 RepID=UPI003BAEFA9D